LIWVFGWRGDCGEVEDELNAVACWRLGDWHSLVAVLKAVRGRCAASDARDDGTHPSATRQLYLSTASSPGT